MPPRPRPVPPEPEKPWTDDELARIVEAAVRFIAEAKERHGKELGFEVGTYLFREVYGEDAGYLRRNDPTKTRSLRDIANGSGVPYDTLYGWTTAAMMRILMEREGFSTELTLRHLEAMVTLEDDLGAAIALAEWAEARRVRAVDMPAIVKTWREHVEDGGDWKDLVERKPVEPPGPKPRRRKRKRLADDELVVPRLAAVIGKWIAKARMSDARRLAVRARRLGIRARLVRPGRGS